MSEKSNKSLVMSSKIFSAYPQSLATIDFLEVLQRMHGNQVPLMQARINVLEEENSKLQKEKNALKELVLIDPLTGAYNRAYLKTIAEELIANEMRGQRAWGVLMLDIDFFKNINDQYGHPCGDEILKNIVAMLKHLSRKGDAVVRYGGEEFLILLLNIESDSITVLAERYKIAIASMFTECDSKQIRITISVGACFVPDDSSMELSHVIKYSDNALYEAKKSGRNCVRIYSDRRKIHRDHRDDRY